MKRGIALSLALAALLPGAARAAFEDLGAGARAPGMGNAFTALADDVHAIHYNPAGLAHLERPQLSMSYARMYMGLSDGSELGSSQLSYAQPLKMGRWGVLGGSWERFSADSMYTEQAIYASWGKRLHSFSGGSQLLMGLNAKYLMRSFQPGPEAANAKNELNSQDLGPDPVLSGVHSKGTQDLDLGFIYKLPRRLQLAVMIQHAMEPDVGFASTDKLKRNIRLGAAYRSLWMNLAGEIRNDAAPNGSTDRDIILAAERFFPTLDRGQFGVRGSMGIGSREWKQMTMGLSYRINKIQADYAFVMPIGTVSGTAGTHRFGMTFHFGAPAPEEEISQDLLRQAERLREKGKGYAYEFNDALRKRTLDDPALARVRMLIEARKYRDAHRTLLEVAENMPADEGVAQLSNRLGMVTFYYPDMSSVHEKWEVLLSSGIRSFFYGGDRVPLLLSSYALSLVPGNTKLDKFVDNMEQSVGLKAERLPAGHPRGFIEELLFRVEGAYNRGDNDKVITSLQDILMLEPENATALERVGSSYFIIGRYGDALDAWERALPVERNPREKKSLETYLRQVREKLHMPASQRQPMAMQAEPEARRSSARPAAARPAQAREVDPAVIQRLYQKGVEHYARGENLQATSMFMRILQLDPSNAQAQKALERLKNRQ